MVRRDHASIIVDNEELHAKLKNAEDWNNWYQDQLNSAWLEEGDGVARRKESRLQ